MSGRVYQKASVVEPRLVRYVRHVDTILQPNNATQYVGIRGGVGGWRAAAPPPIDQKYILHMMNATARHHLVVLIIIQL